MILIREARREEIALIAQFQVEMALETENLQLAQEIVFKGVQGVFDRPDRGLYFVAELQETGEVVACVLTIPEWSDWRNGTVLWIHSVYVKPEARRRGIFRKFYLHLQNLVHSQPVTYKGLRLYVDKGNERAQKVYHELGMSCEHYNLYEWLL